MVSNQFPNKLYKIIANWSDAPTLSKTSCQIEQIQIKVLDFSKTARIYTILLVTITCQNKETKNMIARLIKTLILFYGTSS